MSPSGAAPDNAKAADRIIGSVFVGKEKRRKE
jgi:hypothetical protein